MLVLLKSVRKLDNKEAQKTMISNFFVKNWFCGRLDIVNVVGRERVRAGRLCGARRLLFTIYCDCE
ncbi:hypothetical protein J6590_038424 [Homalodisca vitripennis]|nr:hypothetical protein J6590_038424 [Homalodisca vitripennis]